MVQSHYQPQYKRAVELSMTTGLPMPTVTVSVIKYTLLGDSEELMSTCVLVHVCGCVYTHLIYLVPIFNDSLLHFTLPIVVCLGSEPPSISNFATILRGKDGFELGFEGFQFITGFAYAQQGTWLYSLHFTCDFFFLLMVSSYPLFIFCLSNLTHSA